LCTWRRNPQIIGSGEFNWKHAAIAGAVGCGAGMAAPLVATSYVGAAALGALTNIIQYGITQYVDNCSVTVRGLIINGFSGALGGALGGAFKSPSVIWDTPDTAV
jgi:hypothetical protein